MGLSCLSGLCVDAQNFCPFDGDGVCDEPARCLEGTDSDCCATTYDGECEELGMGGECPNGTDSYDCDYCPPQWIEDGLCDEPIFCPTGTDAADCCASFGDGTCEEVGMGGECNEGTDFYDCGYCPDDWLKDGVCDEIQRGGDCPTNTDSEDCCATWDNDVCEEATEGGECPMNSDYLDCGYCPAGWVEDGICDEVGVGGTCPVDSDGSDCCATFRDGTCEEESMGGMCGELSDWYDCGYCPEVWIEDGQCDETMALWACPEDTDTADCAQN
jgi:hypothetical protein